MKIKTSELQGAALDYAVAMAEGITTLNRTENGQLFKTKFIWRGNCTYSPSTVWAQGGPIIERELLQINPRHHNETIAVHPRTFAETIGWHWEAYVLGPNNIDDNFEAIGETPLIAAMRCYVASKLGDTVEIPDELL